MSHVRVTFWSLVVIAVAATGALSTALAATSGPAPGIAVAMSASVLAVACLLAVRILVVVSRRSG